METIVIVFYFNFYNFEYSVCKIYILFVFTSDACVRTVCVL